MLLFWKKKKRKEKEAPNQKSCEIVKKRLICRMTILIKKNNYHSIIEECEIE